MEQGAQKIQGELFSRGYTTDLAAEFILPDYQPEIRRLLRVRAVPLPVDQYISGSAAEFSGAVEFQALYAAEDHSLWCVTKREDYRLSCPFEAAEFDLSEGPVCDIQTETEDVSGRVLAPRKLSARCRVRSLVRMLADRPVADPAGGENADTIERMTGTISASRIRLGKSEPITLTDELPLDASRPPVRVISATGEVLTTEAQAGTDFVACRGDVYLTLLCAAEQPPALEDAGDCIPAAGTVTELVRRIPFAVEIPVDGATPACACNAWGSCAEIAVTVEDSRILSDVTLVLNARAVCREEIPFTQDAYSTVQEVRPVFQTIPVQQVAACATGNCSVSAAKPLSEIGIRPGSRVLETTAHASLLPPESSRGKFVLPGSVRFRVLTQAPDGEFSTAEFDVPFRFDWQSDASSPAEKNFSLALPALVKASVDGERLLAESELAIALDLESSTSISALAELHPGDPLPEKSPGFIICFPSKNDSPWSVAKHYHVPLHSILPNNKFIII